KLQRASHTTGGVICGHAYGNVFNLADSHDLETDATALVMGKVYIYDSCPDPATTKPKSAFKLKVTTTLLGVVLPKLAEKDFPVHCQNSRIFVYEDDLWYIKGCYSTAIK
ncbi:hypothetical protein L208DRAFT_1082414, partial [Tricholoma matsutake]